MEKTEVKNLLRQSILVFWRQMNFCFLYLSHLVENPDDNPELNLPKKDLGEIMEYVPVISDFFYFFVYYKTIG